MNAPRIAVIGSGPSGLYTVAALLAAGRPVHVDVIDRLPTPYGLVARVLGRTAAELRETDVPARVLAALGRSAVRDIHVLIRRGPADVKFTPAELFQLSELADADVPCPRARTSPACWPPRIAGPSTGRAGCGWKSMKAGWARRTAGAASRSMTWSQCCGTARQPP